MSHLFTEENPQSQSNMPVRAVVLAGGGSRGAYQIGVWKALNQLNWKYHIVTGTSVGALNGALMCVSQYDFACKMWENISTNQIMNFQWEEGAGTQSSKIKSLHRFIRKAFKEKGIDQTPLRRLLKEAINEEQIRNSPIEFGIVTVVYPSFKPVTLFKEEMEPGSLIDYLLASSACFPAMKAYRFNGNAYIDGGFYDNMPIQMAVDKGATEIVAVDLDGLGFTHPVKDKKIKIIKIKSFYNLGPILHFEGQSARKNIQLGYMDAMKAFGKLDGFRYTFFPESFSSCLEDFILLAKQLADMVGISVTQFPQGQNILSPLLQYKLQKEVRKNSRGKVNFLTSCMVAAESAAAFLQLSPYEIYSIESFNRQLSQQFLKIEPCRLDFADLKAALQALGDPQKILWVAWDMITSAVQSQPNQAALILLAELYPGQILAALYLYIIGQYHYSESPANAEITNSLFSEGADDNVN